MGVRFYNNKNFDLLKLSNDEQRKKTVFLDKEEKEQKNNLKTFNAFEFDFSANEIISNYARANLKLSSNRHFHIKDGHSRYEYKGGRLDIYKRKDEYKSQFVHPKDYDVQEFIDKFPELETQPIVKSNGLNDSIKNINGELDEIVSQSSTTGDCWLLASIISMSKTEKGKEIIQNSITVNDDNTVTVAFKGIGVSYTLTQNEIEKYDTDQNTYDSYSNGDNDVLVLELAVEKLWKDIKSGKVKLDTNNENITYTGEYSGIEDGGLPSQMIYYLTGIESSEYYYEDARNLNKSQIYKILENTYKSNNTVLNFGIYNNTHSCTLTDGSKFSLDVGNGGHALAVTNITSDTVTFVNPWDSTQEYTATWAEFASLGIGYISSTNLNEAIEKEVVDMTDSQTEDEYNYNPYSDYDYGFDYDYRKKDYNYDYFRPVRPDFDDNTKPDFDDNMVDDIDNKEIGPDFDNEDLKPDFKPDSNYNNQNYITELLSELLEMFKYLLSFLRV